MTRSILWATAMMARLCLRRITSDLYLPLNWELVLEAALAASQSTRRIALLPFRVRPILRFPALSLLPGHKPAQEARFELRYISKGILSIMQLDHWCSLGTLLTNVTNYGACTVNLKK